MMRPRNAVDLPDCGPPTIATLPFEHVQDQRIAPLVVRAVDDADRRTQGRHPRSGLDEDRARDQFVQCRRGIERRQPDLVRGRASATNSIDDDLHHRRTIALGFGGIRRDHNRGRLQL